MAVETVKKVAVQYLLENGYDADGNMRYKTQTLQYISKSGYDADKVLAVTNAMKFVLNQTMDSVQAVKTDVITAS